jgi:hypothetical protein
MPRVIEPTSKDISLDLTVPLLGAIFVDPKRKADEIFLRKLTDSLF